MILAVLQRLTPLNTKVKDETRWRSTYQILKRHVEIYEYISSIDCHDVDDLCLSKSSERKIEQLLSQLHDLDEVTLNL